jgi:outer membrane protein OmpA-like peptidoglycan-associated protein
MLSTIESTIFKFLTVNLLLATFFKMKNIALLIVFFFGLSIFSLAQTNDQKHIDKGDFAKAEKNLTKDLEKNPSDIAALYTMALLHIKRGYEKYNAQKAYDYISNAINLYANLTDEKELKDLFKIPLNQEYFDNVTNTICKEALTDANGLNTVEGFSKFLDYYKRSPQEYKDEAVENRNIAAYKIALSVNTVASFQEFITTYPNAQQIKLATAKRNALAFNLAKEVNTIKEYEKFISTYPAAVEVEDAWSRIHELAFASAKKENSAKAYKAFMDKYPKSKQFTESKNLYQERQFLENTTVGAWESYRGFIENYGSNPWIENAKDSIFLYGEQTQDLNALKYVAKKYTGGKKKTALIYLHDLITSDGEKITLDEFYGEFDDPSLEELKNRDYALAELGDNLNLHLSYSDDKSGEYDSYIRQAAPKERAFVALQRMISPDINKKNWQGALTKVNAYKPLFGEKNKKIDDLISILTAKWDPTIKIQAFGPEVNTKDGGEYSPVISADERYIYFCGRNRPDGNDNEDIYFARLKTRSPAQIITDLSNYSSNDAPQSVSTDGTSLIFFRDGDLLLSEKTEYGWGNTNEFPERINAGSWQSDAMVTSDGNALLFSSIREGNFDYYGSNRPANYHGDNVYAADIYVSLKNEWGQWGEPINLGKTINTIYGDREPFLHPDMKTLYFSSSGHGGIGQLDVFKSTRLDESCWDCWSEPVNMGKEINTPGNDSGYKISTDGDKAYFAKNEPQGDYDLFWLNLPKHLRPDFVATISGSLLDRNNQPVTAEIRWEDLQTGKSVGQSKSDPTDGSFYIVLPLGKIYGYYVDKDGYFPISNNIDLKNNSKPIAIDSNIDLVTFQQMIDDGITVPINNLFFETGKYTVLSNSIPELKRIAKIIQVNNLKVVIEGHTDNVGEDAANLTLSEQRANAVKEFLIKEGCNPSQLNTKGFGKTKPVAPNDTDKGRAKNRRVELKLTN